MVTHRRRTWHVASFMSVLAMSGASVAEAQTRRPPQPARQTWELGGGLRWHGAIPFDSADANERDPTGAPFTLFKVQSQLDDVFGAEIYVSQGFSRSWRFELAGSYTPPQLSVSVSDDVENAEATLVEETITQLAMDFAVLYEPRNAVPSRKTVPFLIGGAGFSRELHDGQTLVETAQTFFGGAGVKRFFARGQARRSVGLRFDARALFRMNGVALDDQMHMGVVVAASIFKQF